MAKGIKTKKLLWVFDCCFSGGIIKKGKKTGRGTGKIPIPKDKNGKVIVNGEDDFYFQNKALIASSDSMKLPLKLVVRSITDSLPTTLPKG